MRGSVAALLALVAILTIVAYLSRFSSKAKPESETEDSAPMPRMWRRILVAYLLIVGVGIVYMLASLATVEFPETPLLPELATFQATPSQPAGNQSTAPGGTQPPSQPSTEAPVLLQVIPYSTPGNTPTLQLTLYGRYFTRESTVRVNMSNRAYEYLEANLLRISLLPSDVPGVGVVSVDVVNPPNRISNAVVVPIRRPRTPLNVFSFSKDITREMQLLLLALFAGALGSYVHALKSLSDYIGNQTLTASWFWWYITRPFLGMAMSLMFYALLRGGFLAGTAADASVVNPFGVIAIGALVGMFADKAALKLAEIFDTLFKAEDRRSGKLNAPVILKIDPPVVSVGGGPVSLKIVGDRLGKVTRVRLNADERKPDSVSDKEVTLTLQPSDLKARAQIKVTVVNDEGTASPASTLHVTDLAITTHALPDAKVNDAYQPPTLRASGGGQEYKWSLEKAPTWLSIDESGQLSGKPLSAGAEKIVVKVTDKEGAFMTTSFDLKVGP